MIDDFKDKGYNFKHIEDMNIKTKSNKKDMTYDFYIKHNMPMITKNRNLIFKFPESWRHPLNRKVRKNYIIINELNKHYIDRSCLLSNC